MQTSINAPVWCLTKQIDPLTNMKNWFNHPALKKSQIAAILFGENTKIFTSKLSQKEKGQQKWTLDELLSLEKVRQNLVNELETPDEKMSKILREFAQVIVGTKACYGFIQSINLSLLERIKAKYGGQIHDCRVDGFDFVWKP